MKTSRGETYRAVVFRRIENENEWEEIPSFEFNCRIASDNDLNSFVPTQGLYFNEESLLLYVSDLPQKINVHDKVMFLGKMHLVQSVGYYLNKNRVVNANIFSSEKIYEISPKGVRLS